MAYTYWARCLRALCLACLAVGIGAAACTSPDFGIGDSEGINEDGSTGITGSGGTTPSSGEGGGAGGPAHCGNGVTDVNETDNDCGGPDCDECKLGQSCNFDSDCVNDECTESQCRDASCMDGVMNGKETDINCGGPDCPACVAGQSCAKASDCTSNHCEGGICQEATCKDRIRNGNETDIDCGGDCSGCEVGDHCLRSDDCEAPPDARSESTNCDAEDKVCVLICGSGTADCNESASDGCEVSLFTDIDHCGGCDHPCDLDNAETQCQGGSCQIVACLKGFENCNNDTEDGCEVAVRSDPDNCGQCNEACSNHNGTGLCVEGECDIECNEGFENCNENPADGCEANLNRDVEHCQECETACESSSEDLTPFCDGAGDGCGETECESGFADCDGDEECTDDLTSVEDCGRCGNACDVPHGTPACVEGACAIESCDSGAGKEWQDCDGSVLNGCERNLASDKRYCGSCDTDCTTILDADLQVTGVGCSEGGCVVTSCDTGWADCDGDFENGCETDVTSDTERCGGCADRGGVDCSKEYSHGSGACDDSTCTFEACEDTFADCNKNAGAGRSGDGCETSITFNDEDCGGCGVACETGVGTRRNTCGGESGTTCVPQCAADYGDCDGNPTNGCESSLLTDDQHCGACDNECEDVHGVNSCRYGICAPDCDKGYQSCDDNPSNGCEQSTRTLTHCGACDDDCSAEGGGVAACSAAGECSVTCSGNYRSCNDEDSARDGCETNIMTSANHCGGCGQSCAGTNVATRACSGGTCAPTCESGYCRAANPANGCTVPLGTPDNCASCGDSCSAPTPFCRSDGGSHCDHLDIEVVNSDTGLSNAWGNGGQRIVNLAHQLESSAGSYRMIAIAVGSNTGPPTSVSYAGVSLGAPVATSSANEVWAGIYTALDGLLPSPGQRTVSVHLPDGWGWGQVNVVEFTGVDQTNPLHSTTGDPNDSDCATAPTRSSGVSFSSRPGSFIYAMVASRQGGGAVLSAGTFVSTFSERTPDIGNYEYMAAALSGPQDVGATAMWTMTGCYASASAAIGIQRAETR